jgi:septal ring factor EnvC (AmiA/AmiB activator)
VTQAAPPVQQPGPWGPAVVHKADDVADAASVEDAGVAAAQAAAAEKAKRLKQARYQKRKEQEQLARQRDDQQYSTALGYNQEPSQASAPVFGMFGPRRF